MSDCAVGSDGRLKDASEIKWFNDPDDTLPIPVPLAGSTQPIHPFFTGATSPAALVAGSRRSSSQETIFTKGEQILLLMQRVNVPVGVLVDDTVGDDDSSAFVRGAGAVARGASGIPS
jgi:hypothetical protein